MLGAESYHRIIETEVGLGQIPAMKVTAANKTNGEIQNMNKTTPIVWLIAVGLCVSACANHWTASSGQPLKRQASFHEAMTPGTYPYQRLGSADPQGPRISP